MNVTYKEYIVAKAPRFSPYGARAMFPTTARSALAQARHAQHSAAIVAKWDSLDGYEPDQCYPGMTDNAEPYEAGSGYGPLRIRAIADMHTDPMDGDMFNPDVNTDIPRHILKREEQAERDRIDAEGVWGYIAEYWNGREWLQADSIWGFVGDDFTESGHREDLMSAAMDALAAVRTCECCGQPIDQESN